MRHLPPLVPKAAVVGGHSSSGRGHGREESFSCQVGHGQAGRPNVPKQRREDQNHIPNFILMGLVQNLVTESYSVPGHDGLDPWHLLGWLRNLSSCLLPDKHTPWQGHRNGTLYQFQSPQNKGTPIRRYQKRREMRWGKGDVKKEPLGPALTALLCKSSRKPQSSSGKKKKRGSCSILLGSIPRACPAVWVGQRDTQIPSIPHHNCLLLSGGHKQLKELFNSPGGVSLNCWWGSDPDVKVQVHPLHPQPQQFQCFCHDYTPVFLHSSLFTSSSDSPWSQTGFSHSFSHLLYLPPPLTHFSSSPSSCLFSFFSYNPVHLDNFHLDCLT